MFDGGERGRVHADPSAQRMPATAAPRDQSPSSPPVSDPTAMRPRAHCVTRGRIASTGPCRGVMGVRSTPASTADRAAPRRSRCDRSSTGLVAHAVQIASRANELSRAAAMPWSLVCSERVGLTPRGETRHGGAHPTVARHARVDRRRGLRRCDRRAGRRSAHRRHHGGAARCSNAGVHRLARRLHEHDDRDVRSSARVHRHGLRRISGRLRSSRRG
jgi:hypothetical protein